MPAPLASILIPAYNRAHYLPETIDSALAQTYTNLEVVVVDDGSTDNTAQVVAAFTDPRVRYIPQANRGVSGALNTGVRKARGEYIAQLGSDDVMRPQHLATLLPLLEKGAALGFAYGRAQGMNAAGKPLPQMFGAPPKFAGRPLPSILYADCVCAIASLARRELVLQVGGFNESLIANEDWDLWIRLAERAPFAYCDRALSSYRLHASNLTGVTSGKYDRIIHSRIQVIENYYRRPNLPAEALAVKSLAFRNAYTNAIIRYLTIHHWRDALTYYARAVQAGPNPLANLFRAPAVAAFDLYLSKTNWGTRFTDRLVARRHAPRA